jgi:alpha-2-macroglobulin
MGRMGNPRGISRLPILLAVVCALGAQGTPSHVAPAAPPVGGWKEVDRLVSEQKFAEAAKIVDDLLARARTAKDDAVWTRALVRRVQLEIGLHGYETGVRFLKEQPRPSGLLSRVTLDLFYGETLVTYARAYSWEISGRERVEAPGVDLKAWTREQIFEEALRAYGDAWASREALSKVPIGSLSEYVSANSYPAEIRGTVRDAVTYLAVDLLADTTGWTPSQSSSVEGLSLTRLLSRQGSAAGLRLEGPGHPLEKIVAALADLEAWHAAAEQDGAALEARLERLRRLHAAFTQGEDRAAIRKDLETGLAPFRDVAWWSEGMATLARLRQAEEAPDNLVRALAAAHQGEKAYPGSPGGEDCRAIAAAIQAPDFQVASMSEDGPRRRSLQVTHKNVGVLYLRAYPVDLVTRVESATDYNLLPAEREVRALLDRERPAASWSVALPPTPDFKPHRTFVTPPMEAPGLYVVVLSARPDFAKSANRIVSVNLIVSDLVMVTRPEEFVIEARVLAGRSGEPVDSAAVTLYRFDWNHRHAPVEQRRTRADGSVRFEYTPGSEGRTYFLLARKGKDTTLDANYLSLSRRVAPTETIQALLYTDRAIYRPAQTIDWKVLVYRGRADLGRFQTLASSPVTVSLVDANNQKVETKTLSTNEFGTAAGEFRIPPGRALGNWRLESSAGGSCFVSVEEYKRPTFEVSWKDPEGPVRLNHSLALIGDARYYFGLPVAQGTAVWRVTRQAEIPWWWWSWGWIHPGWGQPETVAQGSAALSSDGGFRVVFTPKADERLKEKSNAIIYRYVATADVIDEGGETRSATRSFRVGFVGVEATARMDAAFFRTGEPAAITLVRTDTNGAPKAGSGTWRVLTLTAPASPTLPSQRPAPLDPAAERSATPGDRQRPRWDVQESVEAELREWKDAAERSHGTVLHDAKGEARIALPELPAGAYRLRYETADELGAKFELSQDFVVAGRGLRLPVAAALLAESSSVPVGKTARLLALSGFPGQPVSLELYRDGRLIERRALKGAESPLLEFPIGEKDRGGFGARLSILRDHQWIALTAIVFVPWDDKKLDLSFATFRDRIRPGTSETWRVTVKAPDGKPVEERTAELLAYMYDRSLDAFRPQSPPDPLAIYPNHTSPGYARASVGEVNAQWVFNEGYGAFPSGPALVGDRLKFLDGYGIGGPGRHRGLLQEGAANARVVDALTVAENLPASAPMAVSKSAAIGGFLAEREDRSVASAEAPAPAALRSEFSETAFWKPHLFSGPGGEAAIEFTVPDSVTSWNVWVHAVTRDLKGGSLRKETQTIKDLMVRPYVPRFLREGDRADLKVVVNNATDKKMSGRVSIEILDASTQTAASGEFGLPAGGASAEFEANGKASGTVTFPISAPRRVGTYSFKVTASTGSTSDGELRPVPVLPGRLHLVQSRFVTLKPGATRTMTFQDMAAGGDPSLVNEQLVVTVDAQLFESVLNALPYLVHYPYECTEQTLNRFVPTAIVSSLFRDYPAVAKMAQELSRRDTRLETWSEPDPNRAMALEETPWLEIARGGRDAGGELARILDPKIAKAEEEAALAKLVKAQTASGGFPWWPGGPPSPYMTVYILHGFASSLEFGGPAPREAVEKAWAYAARYVREELDRCIALDGCWEFATFLNYTMSSYPDPSWYAKAFTPADRKRLMDFSFRHWKQHSPYLKAQLALVLQRAGRADDARLVWDSVMDSSKTDPDLGTYWAREDRSWLWYNDTIETQAFALRTLSELSPKDPRRDGLVQWLFLNKKLNQWKSTKATAEVIASLARYLKAEGALSAREAVSVSVGKEKVTFTFEPDHYTGKHNQVMIPGEKIDPKASSTIAVSKEGPGLAFASATWHFSTEKLPAEERGDFFFVSRRYFKRESTSSGFVLKPLAEGTAASPGDEIEVQISLRAKHAAEYVHLRDPRAAGLEPENVLSRYKWDLGIAWYEETRDSGTNFFFEQLPAGEYTFKYRLRASMGGTFRVGPAMVQSMYAPEFAAYSTGETLTVR